MRPTLARCWYGFHTMNFSYIQLLCNILAQAALNHLLAIMSGSNRAASIKKAALQQ